MTNYDIYKLVRFILRKDDRGYSNLISNFSKLLQQANLDYFKEKSLLYQQTQEINDSLAVFEKKVNVYNLTYTEATITLPTDYAHFAGMYWVDNIGATRVFDLVTDSEWGVRCANSISVPSVSFPICKISGNSIYVYPMYVKNTDWFLPSRDELTAMWSNLHENGIGEFTEAGTYWSSSENDLATAYARQFIFGADVDFPNSKSTSLYVRACRSFDGIAGDYSIGDAGPSGGWIFYLSVNGDVVTYYEAAPLDQSSGKAWSNVTLSAIGTTGEAIGDGEQNTQDIINQAGHTDSAAKICDDFIADDYKRGTTNIYYIKYPSTPILDYYIDANGNYVYLSEGEYHDWSDGEIDSNGIEHSAGSASVSVSGYDYQSKTIELEWRDQDKLNISHRILRTMGISINEQSVAVYAQQIKNQV